MKHFILIFALLMSAQVVLATGGTETGDAQEETDQERYDRENQEYQQRMLEHNRAEEERQQASMEASAQRSQDQANKNGMINMIGGGAMMAYGIYLNSTGAGSAAGTPMIIMGGMMMMQGMANRNTGDQTGFVRRSFNEVAPQAPGFDPGEFTSPDWTTPPGFEPGPGGGGPTANDLLGAAEALGVTFDPETQTVNTPKGPIPFSSAGSASGLAAAGFSAKDAMAAEAALERLRDQAGSGTAPSVSKMGFSNAGGGGGLAGGGYSAGEASDPFANLFKKLNKKDKKKVDRGLAGMTKAHHGELIGVAGDNIFKMLNRRYFKKCKAGELIGCK